MRRPSLPVVSILLLLAASVHAYDSSAAASDLQAGGRMAAHVPWSELLGPLAPLALSPFFGMACLSGISILVTRGVLPANAFLHGNPVLNHGYVFAAFLILAVFTSLPRLTKVSKPVAQLCDFLETYAVIVAVVIVHLLSGAGGAEEAAPAVAAGWAATSVSALIVIASVVNILVIQTVRFFFEMLILVSPFPLLDAAFEAGNKLACAALLAVYAYSPWLAFVLNAVMFLLCLAVFRRVHRSVVYYRHILLYPAGLFLGKRFGLRDPKPWREDGAEVEVTAFVAEGLPRIPRRCRALLIADERAVEVHRTPRIGDPLASWPRDEVSIQVIPGWPAHRIEITPRLPDLKPVKLHLSRIFSAHLEDLSSKLT